MCKYYGKDIYYSGYGMCVMSIFGVVSSQNFTN